jgi:AraC family L-rhamnose operon regulatory protein RhaS
MKMKYTTKGKVFYPDYYANMYFCNNETFQNQGEVDCRYQIILIEKGCGFLKVGETRSVILSPMICCLNEKERVEIEKSADIKARSLYFSPDIINKSLSFDNMHDEAAQMALTDSQDRWYLRPFYLRDSKYPGIFHVEDSLLNRLSRMLTNIGKELELQPDDGWPCRSRAFLIELIMFLCRIYDCPSGNPIFQVTDSSCEIDPVLMYLHANYQNKITLQKLSKDFHTNKTTLNIHFKRATGVTAMNYLYKLRISIACAMLRNTLLSISEILSVVGFKDDAHFGRIFKKHIQCSPSEYRERNCWMLY